METHLCIVPRASFGLLPDSDVLASHRPAGIHKLTHRDPAAGANVVDLRGVGEVAHAADVRVHEVRDMDEVSDACAIAGGVVSSCSHHHTVIVKVYTLCHTAHAGDGVLSKGL
jgi:hypothetical protein